MLRRERGLSQRELSGAAGITRQAVGAIESGRTQPGVGIALALARTLGTTVEELFGERGEPAPPPARTAAATIGGGKGLHALTEGHLPIEPAANGVPKD